jgi:hypothetical protein
MQIILGAEIAKIVLNFVERKSKRFLMSQKADLFFSSLF